MLIVDRQMLLDAQSTLDGADKVITHSASSIDYTFGDSDHNIFTGQVTDMDSLFANNFTFNADIGYWNTRNVTTMMGMFFNTEAFNYALNTNGYHWDTSKVSNMAWMFSGASAFDQNLAAWDVSSLVNAEQMLDNSGLSIANYSALLIGWSTRDAGETAVPQNVNLGAEGLFYSKEGAAGRALLTANGWTIGNDKVNQSQFISCYERANVGTVGTAGECNQMLIVDRAMLVEATHIANGEDKAIRLGGSDYTFGDSAHNIFTGQVTDMHDLFEDDTDFNADIGYWNTANVIYMSSMFDGAFAFNRDIGAWDLGSATNLHSMFYKAAAFNQNIGGWQTQAVTNMVQMFYGASAFNQNIGGWDISNLKKAENMLDKSAIDTANYNQLLLGWATLNTGAGETLIPGNIYLGAKGMIYTDIASHGKLTSEHEWTIDGDTLGGNLLVLSAGSNVDISENIGYVSPRPTLQGMPSGVVKYTLGGSDANKFTIDTLSGVVKMIARDFVNPVDSDGDNRYHYSITATDETNKAAIDDVVVSVQPASMCW